MQTIYKYELVNVPGRQTLRLTEGAKILCIQIQSGTACVWVQLDTDAQPWEFTIRIVGTGHNLQKVKGYEYVGTFQDPPYVWHVYAKEGF